MHGRAHMMSAYVTAADLQAVAQMPALSGLEGELVLVVAHVVAAILIDSSMSACM